MPRDISSVRLNRLNDLLRFFREKECVARDELFSQLAYNHPRMLERDLAYLREQFQVQISYDFRRRVYILQNPGTFVLRMALSEREAMAVASGLEMVRHFLPHLDAPCRVVWEKLRTVVPGHLARNAEMLARSSVVSLPVSTMNPEHFEVILGAIHRRRVLETRYVSPYNPTPTERRHLLSPWGVYFRAHAWYLWAWSHEAGEERIFRISRFRRVALASEAYVEAPAENDVAAFADGAWYAWGGKEGQAVEVRIAPPLSLVVAETKWHATQQLEAAADGAVILRACVPSLDEVAHWVLASAPFAEAREPQVLREMVGELAERVGALHGAEKNIPNRLGACGGCSLVETNDAPEVFPSARTPMSEHGGFGTKRPGA